MSTKSMKTLCSIFEVTARIKRCISSLAFVAPGLAAFSGTARIEVQMIDDVTSAPVPGVVVVGTFRDDIGWRTWTESARTDVDREVTDSAGRCIVSGKTNCGKAGFFVEEVPKGYYKDVGWNRRFTTKNALGIWQPDDVVVTVRLHRVEHPIPLKVRRIGDHVNVSTVGRFDGTNMLLKFDLAVGDYLPPDGLGKVADMVFSTRVENTLTTNVNRRVERYFDMNNEIYFPGRGNGLIARMPPATAGVRLRIAPDFGYESSSVLRCGDRIKHVGPNVFHEKYTDTDPNRCYYFRIRSEYDGKGNLVGGYYGKIYEDFKLGFNLKTGCSVEFVYYLNPNALDRNLEWDCRHNLADENVDKKKRWRAPPCMP